MARGRQRARRRSRGRRRPFKAPRLRVLILCEAKATEPNYFRALKRELGLPNVEVKANVPLQRPPNSARARDLTSAARDALRDDFDEVWCVVDHDERDPAIRGLRHRLGGSARALKGARACVSTPCFEYWLLLHFTFTTQPFVGMPGGDSACGNRLLRTHLKDYRKNERRVYDRCRPGLDSALANNRLIPDDQINPNTQIGLLVERLRELA